LHSKYIWKKNQEAEKYSAQQAASKLPKSPRIRIPWEELKLPLFESTNQNPENHRKNPFWWFFCNPLSKE